MVVNMRTVSRNQNRVTVRQMLPAPGEAAHPALALVNSSRVGPRGPVDELEDPASLHGWLAAHALPAEGADPGALRDLRALRDAVRELLRARIEDRLPAAPALVAVNAAAADAATAAAGAAPPAPRLVWTHEPREERDAPGAARPAALAGALLAGDAIGLV